MLSVTILTITLITGIMPAESKELSRRASVYSVSANCTTPGSTPCGGPTPTCCDPGLTCNFRRGIPLCQDNNGPFVSGFDSDTCSDPYLFPCDSVVSVPGFCCPIGTLCVRKGTTTTIQCVNEVGTTLAAFPSATTGFMPSASPVVSAGNNLVTFSPSSAWKTVASDSNCTKSSSLHTTNVVNATVSFNYTGPGIMVHTVTSTNGGVFSLIIDGFNTTTFIDTFDGPGDLALPACYPRQFPGFIATPPGYANRSSHTISLVYIGPSPYSPSNATSNIQFDAFGVPEFSDITSLAGVNRSSGKQIVPYMSRVWAGLAGLLSFIYVL
ncbi:hypothetical protein CPC08DRAFT_714963 [Agrocybe pediades]|nr:hypothetical protein CPC08DRAFT_714963 [Agrocybe pediades]